MSAKKSEHIKSKIEDLFAAVSRFEEAMVATSENADLLRDARIQRFEFCYDLAWKTVKAILNVLGVQDVNNPATSFKKAMLNGYLPLSDETVWVQMIKDRNTTAHVYDLSLVVQVAERLPNYVVLMRGLVERLFHVYQEDIPKT